MSFALISSVARGTNGTTDAIDTTGADLLVVHVGHGTGGDGTITDSKSNTWTALTTQGGESTLWYCLNPTVGTGHTFTVTGGSFPSISVAAFSGECTYDQESGGTDNQPGAITPAANGALLISGFAHQQTSFGVVAVNSGFAIAAEFTYSAGGRIGSALAYFEQATAASIQPTWSNGVAARGVSMASFLPAGGGPAEASGSCIGIGTTAGVSARASDASGNCTGIGDAVGLTARESAAAGECVGIGSLAGQAARASEASGAGVGIGTASGTAARASEASGACVGVGVLTGVADAGGGASGACVGIGVTSGTAARQSAAAGSCRAIASTAGLAARASQASGVCAAVGQTSGTAARLSRVVGACIAIGTATGVADDGEIVPAKFPGKVKIDRVGHVCSVELVGPRTVRVSRLGPGKVTVSRRTL